MKVLAAIGLSSIVLVGCQTKLPSEMSHSELKQFALDMYQRCIDQNVALGSPEMDICTKQEARREINKRFDNRATVTEISKGIQKAGDNHNRTSMKAPAICRSAPSGSFVTTTCS